MFAGTAAEKDSDPDFLSAHTMFALHWLTGRRKRRSSAFFSSGKTDILDQISHACRNVNRHPNAMESQWT